MAHVAIDDHSRLSFTQIHPNEKATSAVAYLKATCRWYRHQGRARHDRHGVRYKSRAFAKACKTLKIQASEQNHTRSKPTTMSASFRPPCANGRMRAYKTSNQRAVGLPCGAISTIGVAPRRHKRSPPNQSSPLKPGQPVAAPQPVEGNPKYRSAGVSLENR